MRFDPRPFVDGLVSVRYTSVDVGKGQTIEGSGADEGQTREVVRYRTKLSNRVLYCTIQYTSEDKEDMDVWSAVHRFLFFVFFPRKCCALPCLYGTVLYCILGFRPFLELLRRQYCTVMYYTLLSIAVFLLCLAVLYYTCLDGVCIRFVSTSVRRLRMSDDGSTVRVTSDKGEVNHELALSDLLEVQYSAVR